MSQSSFPQPNFGATPAPLDTNVEQALAQINHRPCLGRLVNEAVNGSVPPELAQIMALQPAANAQLTAQFEELNQAMLRLQTAGHGVRPIAPILSPETMAQLTALQQAHSGNAAVHSSSAAVHSGTPSGGGSASNHQPDLPTPPIKHTIENINGSQADPYRQNYLDPQDGKTPVHQILGNEGAQHFQNTADFGGKPNVEHILPSQNGPLVDLVSPGDPGKISRPQEIPANATNPLQELPADQTDPNYKGPVRIGAGPNPLQDQGNPYAPWKNPENIGASNNTTSASSASSDKDKPPGSTETTFIPNSGGPNGDSGAKPPGTGTAFIPNSALSGILTPPPHIAALMTKPDLSRAEAQLLAGYFSQQTSGLQQEAAKMNAQAATYSQFQTQLQALNARPDNNGSNMVDILRFVQSQQPGAIPSLGAGAYPFEPSKASVATYPTGSSQPPGPPPPNPTTPSGTQSVPQPHVNIAALRPQSPQPPSGSGVPQPHVNIAALHPTGSSLPPSGSGVPQPRVNIAALHPTSAAPHPQFNIADVRSQLNSGASAQSSGTHPGSLQPTSSHAPQPRLDVANFRQQLSSGGTAQPSSVPQPRLDIANFRQQQPGGTAPPSQTQTGALQPASSGNNNAPPQPHLDIANFRQQQPGGAAPPSQTQPGALQPTSGGAPPQPRLDIVHFRQEQSGSAPGSDSTQTQSYHSPVPPAYTHATGNVSIIDSSHAYQQQGNPYSASAQGNASIRDCFQPAPGSGGAYPPGVNSAQGNASIRDCFQPAPGTSVYPPGVSSAQGNASIRDCFQPAPGTSVYPPGVSSAQGIASIRDCFQPAPGVSSGQGNASIRDCFQPAPGTSAYPPGVNSAQDNASIRDCFQPSAQGNASIRDCFQPAPGVSAYGNAIGAQNNASIRDCFQPAPGTSYAPPTAQAYHNHVPPAYNNAGMLDSSHLAYGAPYGGAQSNASIRDCFQPAPGGYPGMASAQSNASIRDCFQPAPGTGGYAPPVSNQYSGFYTAHPPPGQ